LQPRYHKAGIGKFFERKQWFIPRTGFKKYAIDVGSGVMISIPIFIKIGSGIQKFVRGYRYTQISWRSHKPT
jgi:hypothetical protein